MSENHTCVYVTDRGFLACSCFSALTLHENATAALDIIILCIDVSGADIVEAREYLEDNGVRATFQSVPSTQFDGLPRPQSLPTATYGRLMMHKYLSQDLERVLYIDGDTLVDIDVAPLFGMPLEGNVIGAVLDMGRVLIGRREEAQERLDLGPSGDYFNAGVMLIDWHRWSDEQIGETCIKALLTEPERFTQKDQCALNFACAGKWKPLELKWNFQPACIVHDDRQNALIHFLGGRKPWRTDHLRHPMRFVTRYEQLYRDSPWAEEFRPTVLPYPVKDAARNFKKFATPRYWKNAPRYRSQAARYAKLVGKTT